MPRFMCTQMLAVQCVVVALRWSMRRFVREGLDTSDRTAEDQRVHVLRAFVCVDGLEVRRVSHCVVFVHDAVSSEHVTRVPRGVERLQAVVAFDDGDSLRWELPRLLVLQLDEVPALL